MAGEVTLLTIPEARKVVKRILTNLQKYKNKKTGPRSGVRSHSENTVKIL